MSFCGRSSFLTLLTLLNKLKKKAKSQEFGSDAGESNSGALETEVKPKNIDSSSLKCLYGLTVAKFEPSRTIDEQEGDDFQIPVSCWGAGTFPKRFFRRKSLDVTFNELSDPEDQQRLSYPRKSVHKVKVCPQGSIKVRNFLNPTSDSPHSSVHHENGNLLELKSVAEKKVKEEKALGCETRRITHEDTARVLKEAWELLHRLNATADNLVPKEHESDVDMYPRSESSSASNFTGRLTASVTPERNASYSDQWPRREGIGRMQQTQAWLKDSEMAQVDKSFAVFTQQIDGTTSDSDFSAYELAAGPKYQPFRIVLPNEVDVALRETLRNAPFILETLKEIERMQVNEGQSSDGETETTIDVQGMIDMMEELLLEES